MAYCLECHSCLLLIICIYVCVCVCVCVCVHQGLPLEKSLWSMPSKTFSEHNNVSSADWPGHAQCCVYSSPHTRKPQLLTLLTRSPIQLVLVIHTVCAQTIRGLNFRGWRISQFSRMLRSPIIYYINTLYM